MKDQSVNSFKIISIETLTGIIDQNEKMYEALKEHHKTLRKHPEILDGELFKQYQKIESLLKEIES